MAAAAYEGGAGGKFPKRPSRRAPATPYDRPPAAVRGVRHPAAAEPGGSRWLSKLVDPASRIITRSASRLFSSVFRKRLAAPPAAPEEKHLSRQEDPELPSTNSSSEVGEQCGCRGEKAKDNCDAPGAWEEMNLDFGGISELEHLLKRKTFTRVEFDRLTELLRSRTVEPSTSQPAVNYVNEEKANIAEQANQNKESTAEPSTSKLAHSHDKKEKPNIPEQEVIASFRLHGSVTTPVNLAIPEEEAASPAEIAKAYMGSRSSKVSPSTLSRRSQIFQEDAAPQAKKSLDTAIAPRSAVRFSGIPEHMENDYVTARPHGRSATYRMSRSPYFKAHPVTTIRGGRSLDGYSGLSTSSQWTSTNVMQSGSKSALKRGSSVLDSDMGSLGPIRRIRQKSNVVSPSRNIHLQSSLPRNLLPSPFVPLVRDANQGSASSIQKPLHLDGATDLQDAENGHDRTPSAGVVPIPPQSSEMARKILQELDKLVPSPNEKSSELKIIDRNESPSKLTHSMLRGRALKSMEDIDSSKFLKVQAYDNLDIPSSSHLKSVRSSTFQKQERAGENGPSKPDVTGLQAKPEALARNKSVLSATEAKPGMRSSDFAISVAAAVPSQTKPSFQMSAPEDSLDLDDDNYNIKDSSGLASAGDDKLELISESKTDRPEIIKLERSLGSSSKSMPNSTLILDKRSEVKASDKPVSEKNAAFLFPTASPSSISSQMPSPPMPTPLLERSTQLKEEIAGRTFEFGSKDANSSPLSSTVTAVGNPVSPKFGASNDAPETLLDGSQSDRGGDQKAGDVFKSCGNAASSVLLSSTSPVLFSFGASTTPTLSNGSVTTGSSMPVISAAPTMTFSDNSVTSVFSTSIVTSTSSGSPTISSAAPASSTVPSFQFGSGASTGASTIVTPSLDKRDSNGLEEKSVRASPFGINSFVASGSSVHSSTGSDSAASATSSVFASMGPSSHSSVVQASQLFSSTTSSSLALSSPSVFSGNGVFGSSASAHSSSENLSVGNSSSQSLPSTFGATGGSIFDTQATKPGTGVSNISQNSPSQIGSFNPQLPGSSSSGSTSSQFGSAATTKPFGASSVFPFSTSAGSFSSSASSVSFAPTAPFGTSSGFSFSSGALSSYSSGGSTSFAPTTHFGSSSGFSTGAGISSSPVSSSSLAPTAANMFNSSSQLPTSSIFGSTFGSTTPTPSTGFSFGLSAPSSGSGSPFTFGTSSGPAFSFTSAGAATSSTFSSPFGVQNPAASFGSGSPGNDQMNVEDSMADDTTQASAPVVPTFGQQTNFTATPSFMFGSPAAPSGVFQFGSQQNTNNPQNPSPFQAAGSLEFAAGGSFSLGSGGGDKSGRKIVRVRRDKLRKK